MESSDKEPFISKLLAKLAFTQQVAAETGKKTGSAEKEVLRQIKQVSTEHGGNPISGTGVTKSGKED